MKSSSERGDPTSESAPSSAARFVAPTPLTAATPAAFASDVSGGENPFLLRKKNAKTGGFLEI